MKRKTSLKSGTLISQQSVNLDYIIAITFDVYDIQLIQCDLVNPEFGLFVNV